MVISELGLRVRYFVLLTRGRGRLETRCPVALGSSPELSAFTMSLAPPVHPSPISLGLRRSIKFDALGVNWGSPSSLPSSAKSMDALQWNCPCPRKKSEIEKVPWTWTREALPWRFATRVQQRERLSFECLASCMRMCLSIFLLSFSLALLCLRKKKKNKKSDKPTHHISVSLHLA